VRNRDFASGSGLSLFTRKIRTLSSSDPLYRSPSIPYAVRVLASHVPVPVNSPCICLCFFNLCLAAVLAFASHCWVHDFRPSPTEEIWSRSLILWMFTASTGNIGHSTAGSKERRKVYYARYLSSCRLPCQVRTKPLSYCALPKHRTRF
jgi:hypothetical protein